MLCLAFNLLGNENLYQLTERIQYKLRIDLRDHYGVTLYAEYQYFLVGPESSNYQLTFNGYTGNAGRQIFFLILTQCIVAI